jgi:hypothetical protein
MCTWRRTVLYSAFYPFLLPTILPSFQRVSTHHRLQHSSLIFFVYPKTILSTDALRLNLINPSSSFHQVQFTSAEMAAGPSSQGDSESLSIPEGQFARVFRIHENHNGTLVSTQIGFGQMLDYEGPKRNGKVTVCLVAEGDRSLLWDCNLGRYFRDHPKLKHMVQAYVFKTRPATDYGDVKAVTWWRSVSQLENQYQIHENISASGGEYLEHDPVDEEEAHHSQTTYSTWPTPSAPCRLLSLGPDNDKRYWHAIEERLFYYEGRGLGNDGQYRPLGKSSD